MSISDNTEREVGYLSYRYIVVYTYISHCDYVGISSQHVTTHCIMLTEFGIIMQDCLYYKLPDWFISVALMFKPSVIQFAGRSHAGYLYVYTYKDSTDYCSIAASKIKFS